MLLGTSRNAAGQALTLEVDVDAEARKPRQGVREVDVEPLLELLLLLGRGHPVQELPGRVRGQLAELVEPLDPSVHANRRRAARRDVQVGRLPVDDDLEQLVDRIPPRRLAAHLGSGVVGVRCGEGHYFVHRVHVWSYRQTPRDSLARTRCGALNLAAAFERLARARVLPFASRLHLGFGGSDTASSPVWSGRFPLSGVSSGGPHHPNGGDQFSRRRADTRGEADAQPRRRNDREASQADRPERA